MLFRSEKEEAAPEPEKSDFEAAAEPVFEPRPVAPIILTSQNYNDKMKEITDRLEHGIMGVFESGRYTDCYCERFYPRFGTG